MTHKGRDTSLGTMQAPCNDQCYDVCNCCLCFASFFHDFCILFGKSHGNTQPQTAVLEDRRPQTAGTADLPDCSFRTGPAGLEARRPTWSRLVFP